MSVIRRSPEVRLVASRHDPDLERRARGERRERDGGVVLPDQPIRAARLVANEAAPRALALRGSRTGRRRRAPRRPGAGSGAGRRGRGRGGSSGRRPGRPSSGSPGGGPSGPSIARPRWRPGRRPTSPSMISLPTAWSGRCSPGGATIVRQLPLARAWDSATWASVPSSSRASSFVPTTWNAKSLSVRTRMPVARRQPAVLAVAAVVDQLGRRREPVAVEGPVDDRRDPPARDRVLAQLEQAGGHRVRPVAAMDAATRQASSAPMRRRTPRRRPRRRGRPRPGPSPARRRAGAQLRARSRSRRGRASRTGRSGRNRPGPGRRSGRSRDS